MTRNNNAENTRENLGSLDDEIRQGILNLSAAGNFDKAVIESEIQAIIAKSALGNNSDPSVALLLFRKYADIANEIAYEKRIQTKISFKHIQFDPSALILQDINQDRLVGFKAVGENVFWLRVITCVFAFISMVVMASIPKIGDSNFCPSFGAYCFVHTMYSDNDCFQQKPYWFLIATAAAIAALNLFLVCYYLLSTNDNGKKFIPGVCVLAECPSFVNPLVDFILLASSFAVAIASSVALQEVVYFYTAGASSGYYTIASIYQQFIHTSPPCLSDSDDPSPRLFASIMMMFITSCFMCLCFAGVSLYDIASYNHYRKQRIADAAAPVNDKGVKVLEESSADEV